MSTQTTSRLFRSLTYRSAHIYNWVNQLLYDWKKRFITLGKLVGRAETPGSTIKVLDLSCGTGYLARYLDPSVEYEGWDLNTKFLDKLQLDWEKGRLKPKKIKVRAKNIFDYDDYPEEEKDVIVFSGILHHIFPKHIELVEHAKHHAKKIIICEPYAVKPKDINAHDWTARLVMFLAKHLPERIYKQLDIFLADNDGINSYDNRSAWTYDERGLRELYSSLGIKKMYSLVDEIIGVWEEK